MTGVEDVPEEVVSYLAASKPFHFNRQTSEFCDLIRFCISTVPKSPKIRP